MKNLYHNIIASLVMLTVSFSLANAQDPAFTQFFANPLYLNPALAGVEDGPRVISNYRLQWPALDATFKTYALSYDQPIASINSGLGVQVLKDDQANGTLNTTMAGGTYSYELKLGNKVSMRQGFQGSWFQRSLDKDKLNFEDQIDQRQGFIYQSSENRGSLSFGYFDVSTGFMLFSDTYYGGASFHHITRPREKFSNVETRMNIKTTLHGGAMIPIDERNKKAYFSPNIIYQKQGSFQQINLGFYLSNGYFTGGFWYRHNDAIAALVGMEWGAFTFGYSYDITVSKLRDTGGAHELSITGRFKTKTKKNIKRKTRKLRCPQF